MLKAGVGNEFGREQGEPTAEKEEADFERELEQDLKTDPYLEVHKSDIKKFRSFRRAFHLNRLNPEDLDIYVVHPERNVAITRAFRKGDSIPHFRMLTERTAEADMLRKKSGLDEIQKGAAEWHEGERAKIVVVLDEEVTMTKHLLKNVESGGWLLCRLKGANAVRRTGKYETMGVIRAGSTTVDPNAGDFWKKSEVDDEEAFKAAQTEGGEASYEEAARAVAEAGFSTKNVLESYKKLIELAEKQNASRVSHGETQLTCVVERDGAPVEIVVNTVLPLKEAESDSESIVIFKKHETV
ncbi:MAG: hypothetical protein HYS26_02200 [Candidatus Kaiserbacteria bacterium]|nr:MAG: hypothetical protein HYS26_02200 [Candidatus Kaiserbacteria bacterium]